MRVLPRVGKYVLLALLDRSLHIVAHSDGESESSLGECVCVCVWSADGLHQGLGECRRHRGNVPPSHDGADGPW